MPSGRGVSLLLAAVMAAAVGLRVHTFHEPVDCDEAVYAYIARTMLHGGLPYRDAWGDPKPPGAPFLYAVAVGLVGYNEWAVALVPAPPVLVTVWLAWRVGRRWAGPTAGLLAAGLFALVSSDPFTFANGSNTEVYINALSLAALERMLASLEARPRWNALAAGLCVGCAALFKQVAALHVVVLAAAGFLAWRQPGGWRQGAAVALGFVAGAVLPWLVFLAWAAAHGWDYLIDDVLFTIVVYPLTATEGKAAAGLLERAAGFFRSDHLQALQGTWPLWLVGTGAAVGLGLAQRRAATYLTLAWAGSSLVQIGLPGHYWPHYYMLGLPAMAVLGAAGLVEIGRVSGRRLGLTVAAAFLFGLLSALQWRYYLTKSAEEISRDHQGPQWIGCRDQGRQWAAWLPPDETIFVWGIQAPLYFYSGLDSPTRYFFTDPATELNPLEATGLQGQKKRTIMADLRRRPPALVWSKIAMFPELAAFLEERGYVPAIRQDVPGPDGQPMPLRLYVRRDLVPGAGTR